MHFESGTVAQIVYSGDQTDRGQQQVVYTADGNSFTSVESGEHTLVYIHPADGTQVRKEFKRIAKYYLKRNLLPFKCLIVFHVRFIELEH